MSPWEQQPGAYAGVGSRETPRVVLTFMTLLAELLRQRGFTCRTGGADGADAAFYVGGGPKSIELYLPWDGFNGHRGATSPVSRLWTEPTPEAYEIAARYHPGWKYLKPSARPLHARNVHQVLGRHCDSPSRFVLCWTPDGAIERTTTKTGGTGQAIRIASAKEYRIPVYNLQRTDHMALWREFVR